MKPLIIRIIAISVLLIFSSAQTSKQEQNSILAFGVIKHNDDKVSGVSIKVICNQELIYEIVTGRYIGYGFSLDYNSEYKIEITKEGYLKEIIILDTKVPQDVLDLGDRILWEPDFVIYKIMPGLGFDEFEIPVSRYIFNSELWGFFEDEEYKKEAQPSIISTLNTLKSLQNEAYKQEKARADSLLKTGNYEAAIITFLSAQTYNKSDKSIASEIKSAKKLLKKKTNANDAYLKSIGKADKLFADKKYQDADEYYQKALIYKPKEEYPIDKIYAIDSIRSYKWIRKIRNYEDLLISADSSLMIKKFDLAEDFAKDAGKLFPKKEQAKLLRERIDSIREVDEREQDVLTAQKLKEESVSELNKDEVPEIDKLKIGENVEVKKSARDIDDTPEPIIEDVAIIETKVINRSVSNEKSVKENLEILQDNLQVKIESGDKMGSSEVLEEMGQVYQNDFRHKEALDSYKKSLELKREIGDKVGTVDVLTNIASVMYDSGSYHEAIQSFELSLNLAEELDDKQKSSEILTNIATVYENTFRYDEAIEQLEKSRQLKEETGDKVGISEIHKNKGSIYFEENKFDKAAKELERSVSISLELNNTEELASGLNSLGAAYYRMQKYDKAAEKYKEALEITTETDNHREKSISLNNIGNINFSLKNYLKAIDYYEQSLSLKRNLKFGEGIATSLYNIGNAHFELKEFEKALEYFNASMEAARESKYFEIVWLNYKSFARTYAALGNYKAAFENYREYTSSKFESVDDNLQLVEMREQYESNKIAVKNLRRAYLK